MLPRQAGGPARGGLLSGDCIMYAELSSFLTRWCILIQVILQHYHDSGSEAALALIDEYFGPISHTDPNYSVRP